MEPNVTLGLINIGSALLLFAVSIPLIVGKVKMNAVYGIRLKKSFASEANWYALNAYGGKQLAGCAALLIVAGSVCLVVPINDHNNVILSIVLGVVPITMGVVVAVGRILAYPVRCNRGHHRRSHGSGIACRPYRRVVLSDRKYRTP